VGQDIRFSARCWRCGNQSLQKPDRLVFEARMACHVCGYSGTVVEFADIAVLEAMLHETAETDRFVH
jgi:hypothetical protein